MSQARVQPEGLDLLEDFPRPFYRTRRAGLLLLLVLVSIFLVLPALVAVKSSSHFVGMCVVPMLYAVFIGYAIWQDYNSGIYALPTRADPTNVTSSGSMPERGQSAPISMRPTRIHLIGWLWCYHLLPGFFVATGYRLFLRRLWWHTYFQKVLLKNPQWNEAHEGRLRRMLAQVVLETSAYLWFFKVVEPHETLRFESRMVTGAIPTVLRGRGRFADMCNLQIDVDVSKPTAVAARASIHLRLLLANEIFEMPPGTEPHVWFSVIVSGFTAGSLDNDNELSKLESTLTHAVAEEVGVARDKSRVEVVALLDSSGEQRAQVQVWIGIDRGERSAVRVGWEGVPAAKAWGWWVVRHDEWFVWYMWGVGGGVEIAGGCGLGVLVVGERLGAGLECVSGHV